MRLYLLEVTLKNLLVKFYKVWDLLQISMDEGLDEIGLAMSC